MSLPPSIIQIKRKATDEPVDLLQIRELNNPKKRRTTDYVFSRQSDQPIPSAVRKIKEIHRSASSQALGTSSAPVSRSDTPAFQNLLQPSIQAGAPPVQSAPATSPGTPNSSADESQPFQATQPRRFHISRSATPSIPDTVGGGSRKRKAEPTIFIERRARPKSQDGQAPSRSATPALESPSETPRPQKKPGLAARTSTPPVKEPQPKPGIAPLRNVRLASGEVMPWDVSSERLAAEMEAYTLAEIGKNLAASQHSHPEPKYTSSHIHKSSPSKFKPKAPALRYAQRHPEEKSQNNGTTMDLDGSYVEEEMDDDSEYIIDTYIRMPAEALQDEDASKNIGFLILDSQPDIEEFYREDEGSSEEEDEADEDENAENHYTADYPDEEVDSDDEYNRNAYHYRTHNASDLEEFEDANQDMMFSDDENEGTKYPWMQKKPWLPGPKKGIAGLEDEDE
ncbi:uncharacterized protein PAC_16761 [Phialocephala subalpina]|uniref:Transcription factor Iwr1 domain-containing protein n=1 Tax=Phialocephala subalpina TaxID=576137 RepID=A0A1L7XP84_9HELO|nr:uncharacterized protein PAC_16761 [Phialocephala subalpina]